MKKRILPALRAACLLAVTAAAMPRIHAQEPDTMPQVRVEVLMFSMPEEKFATLAPDLLDPEKIEKAVPDLLDAVKRKEIMLEGCPLVVTKSGQRAVVETAIEYGDINPLGPVTIHTIPKLTTFGSVPDYEPVTGGSPATFESRNIGVTLEVEPVVRANGLIDLNVAPQHAELLGHDYFVIPAGKKEDSAFDGPWQPVFYTMKTTASLTLRSGRHLLLAVHKKAKPAGAVEVFIIGAEILDGGK